MKKTAVQATALILGLWLGAGDSNSDATVERQVPLPTLASLTHSTLALSEAGKWRPSPVAGKPVWSAEGTARTDSESWKGAVPFGDLRREGTATAVAWNHPRGIISGLRVKLSWEDFGDLGGKEKAASERAGAYSLLKSERATLTGLSTYLAGALLLFPFAFATSRVLRRKHAP